MNPEVVARVLWQDFPPSVWSWEALPEDGLWQSCFWGVSSSWHSWHSSNPQLIIRCIPQQVAPSPAQEPIERWRHRQWLRELELSLVVFFEKVEWKQNVQQNRFSHSGGHSAQIDFRQRCYEQGSSCTRLSIVFVFSVVGHGLLHWWPFNNSSQPKFKTCCSC